ncbi:MAG: hypothetical protein GC160_10360 [Acidobacteria bacterium]|nr:hypothetical protein [Acidobacteriota bacterium]
MQRRQWLGAAAGAAFAASVLPGQTRKSPKIAKLRFYRAMVGPRAWLALQVETDNGLTGLGDATHAAAEPKVCVTMARKMFAAMEGRTVFEVEGLRQVALPVIAAQNGGRDHRPAAAAFAGLEQCLWDLQGKVLGLPCSELFGGRLRSQVHNYANINRATKGEARTPEGFSQMAQRGLDAGFDAFKMASFDHLKPNDPDHERFADGTQLGIDCIAAVRQTIGPDRDLLVDGHSKFSREQAIEVALRLEPQKLFWFEEATPGIPNLAALNAVARMPTAGGESLFGVGEFLPYIAGKAVDIVMPDMKFCGGMLELKKIAAMAEAAGMACSPHGPASPIGNMAAAQVCATLPNFQILEFAYGEVPWRGECVTPEEPIGKGGMLEVLDRPGIGYELNGKYWEAYG